MKLLITDTETGGLDPTKQDVLTLGFALWEDNKILDRIEFKVSKEEYRTTEEAMKVNKINLEELRKEGKKEKEIIKELIAFIKKNFGKEKPMLCGHNVNFDKDFIRALFERNFFNYESSFGYRTLDTMSIMTFLFLQGKTETRLGRLDDAIIYFNLEIPEKERHTALGDVLVTIKVLEKMLVL